MSLSSLSDSDTSTSEQLSDQSDLLSSDQRLKKSSSSSSSSSCSLSLPMEQLSIIYQSTSTNSIIIEQRFLECAICTDIYADPRRLPCGHLYCCECLMALWKHANNVRYILCPECKRKCQQPVEQLAKDFLIKNIVESVEQQLAMHSLDVQMNALGIENPLSSWWSNEWELWDNGRVEVPDGRTVKCMKGGIEMPPAVVRAKHPLLPTPRKCAIRYFEVEIVRRGFYWIGFTADRELPKEQCQHSCGIYIDGYFFVNRKWTEEDRCSVQFLEGDVIGAGIETSENGQWFFFTKNGICYHQKHFFRPISDEVEIFPAVGLRYEGEKIEANFGLNKRFKFDLSTYQGNELEVV